MVFRTITENVRSFFQKEEDLERQPKRLKDAAVEVFEKPGPEHHIVAHRLQGAPMLQQAQPKQPPKLPFSSEQLKQRLAQQPQQAGQPQSRAEPRTPRPQITDEDISSQIVEFEQAITTIPGEDGSSLPISVPPKVAAKMAKGEPPQDGYFGQFAQFLRQRGYDVDDALLEEALARMKQHHEHRLVAEKHKEKSSSLEGELSHKLSELQELEREWASRQEDIAIARERSAGLEESIAARTADLRRLVAAMREHVSQAPAPQPASQLPLQPPQSQTPSQSLVSPQPVLSEPLREEAQPTSAQQAPPSSPIVDPPIVNSDAVSAAPPAMAAPPLPPSAGISSTAPAAASAQPLPAEKRFFLHDGRSLCSLSGLRDALLTMDDSLFYYHVTPQRNDFAAWIRGVFGDEPLAGRALHANNKYDLARLLPQR